MDISFHKKMYHRNLSVTPVFFLFLLLSLFCIWKDNLLHSDSLLKVLCFADDIVTEPEFKGRGNIKLAFDVFNCIF